ncbi:hypothetical protein CDV26_08450 [Francisella halioticida]|uniref:Uncharacterized protein n=1 Tax=Francisella halioticida TaxID=549298 RepID=A0ABM6M0X4_9GAMM|nr:hypothetical protein [Francisella halioticida]ASG68418.1 hypothetical protein CDV26_08450 [Francisella halioticida]
MPDSQFAIIVAGGHAIMYKNEGPYNIFVNSGIANLEPFHTINPVDIYKKTKLLFQLSLNKEENNIGINPSLCPVSHKFRSSNKAVNHYSLSPFNKNLILYQKNITMLMKLSVILNQLHTRWKD